MFACNKNKKLKNYCGNGKLKYWTKKQTNVTSIDSFPF